MQTLINIDVGDLAEAETFYRDAFGLSAGRRLGKVAIEMLGAASPIYLLLKAPGTRPFSGAGGTRDYRRHWTPVHLDFVVEDLDAALVRATAAGAIAESEIEEFAWGRLAQFADPFGHGFCLVEFLRSGYDEIADHRDAEGVS